MRRHKTMDPNRSSLKPTCVRLHPDLRRALEHEVAEGSFPNLSSAIEWHLSRSVFGEAPKGKDAGFEAGLRKGQAWLYQEIGRIAQEARESVGLGRKKKGGNP